MPVARTQCQRSLKTDAALEQAEIVLMHDRLENLVAVFRLSI